MTQSAPTPAPIPSHQSVRTYAEHVAAYAQAGWSCILPVPPADKTPPPVGFTGEHGRDTGVMDLVGWAGTHPNSSIALRMPTYQDPNGDWTVIGIDVDAYDKTSVLPTGETKTVHKRGDQTCAHFEQRWGPLPATWVSTARGSAAGPGTSGIRFFRAPAQRYATKLDSGDSADVEIIQRHHRYAVVWPSPHSGVIGADGQPGVYTWYDPAGRPADRPPAPSELAPLPSAWIEGLAAGAVSPGAAASDPVLGQALLDQLLADTRPECAETTSARLQALEALAAADAGSRHDTMTARTHHLIQLAAHGHPGVGPGLVELREGWAALTAGEHREDELMRMLLTSARKAVTVVGPAQLPHDPCLMAGGFTIPAPAPVDDRGSSPETAGGEDPSAGGESVEPLEGVEPERWVSVRGFIGPEAFDPVASLDQPLAEAVLERVWPCIRYAYDSRGWLLRAPEQWESRQELGGWAVAQVAPLMPVGDITAEKGSPAHARAQRRSRLMSSAGASAVAKKINDLVAGGTHPATVRLANLDADPELMWAGGLPWSLRATGSAGELVQAPVDPATPHLHSAGVTPALVPTPTWDVFLSAVWPDEALRRWAVRVLAIALTGYADRALPILLGDTGRGKTQVVHLIMSVLGSYAHAANPKLLSSSVNAHDSIVYALKGRRLSFIDEGPREAKSGQERLKQLTGGGELTANEMNRNPITFTPTHTLVLTANEEPTLTDPAVRARARLIPCDGDPDQVRAARAAIGHVKGRVWRREAPGVLAALMLEAGRWLADPSTGLVTAAPADLQYLAERLGAAQDPVQQWLSEETEPYEPGTSSRELYQAFRASCQRSGIRPDQVPNETRWGQALTRLGLESAHTRLGKKRPLRLRTGEFLPGMGPTASPRGRENVTGCDGFVTGLDPNPSQVKPQVNHSVSVEGDGCDGFENVIAHTRADTRAYARDRAQTVFAPNPSHRLLTDDTDTPVDLRKGPCDGFAGVSESEILPRNPLKSPVSPDEAPPPAPSAAPAPGPAPDAAPATGKTSKRTAQTAAARTAKAAAREAARAAVVLEAAGPLLELPVVVSRVMDGGLTSDPAVTPVSVADADALLSTLTRARDESSDPTTLTLDVETTGYPPGHQHYGLRTVQLGCEQFALVLDPADEEQAEVIRRHVAAVDRLHAHSATADLIPLEVGGLLELGLDEAWSRMHDTVVLAKLVDPALTGSDPGLKQISATMLESHGLSKAADEARARLFKAGKWLTDTKITTPLARSGWAQVESGCTTMLRYAASDVLDDAAIARRLTAIGSGQSASAVPQQVLNRERTAQQMTARVTHRGLRLDGEHVTTMLSTHQEHRDRWAEQVRALTSALPQGSTIENPGSNQQVAAALSAMGANLPHTATGRPSVAVSVLEPLRAQAEQGDPVGVLADAVLTYRHHDTAIGTFLEPYDQLVRHGDGRVRPTIYTLGADTGRMTSVRPNAQQLPREGGFRACFTADPGHSLISADFAGVELRVAAALSGDSNLRAILADPERDLHWEIARLAFGAAATKTQRYYVKRGVFGRIYGGGVGAIARGVGVSEEIARTIIDALDTLLPELTEWSRRVRAAVEAGNTRFPTYAGRVVHLDPKHPYKAPNYLIQGTARELLVDALLRWRETPWGEATLLPVHDELVVHVPEADATAATDALVGVMTTELAGVPIKAEPSAPSFAWADSV